MFLNNPSYLISLRYLKPSKENGIVSIISLFSFLGIILGVSTLIIVMSVMNGFRAELLEKIIGINGHLSLYNNKNINLDNYKNDFINDPKVANVRKIIDGQALLNLSNYSTGVLVKGIEKDDFLNYSKTKDKFNISENIKISKDGAILGKNLFDKLNLEIGDEFKLIVPKNNKTVFGNIPKVKTFKVNGHFESGMYTYDNNLVYIDFDLGQSLFKTTYNNAYLEIELSNIKYADIFKEKILLENENVFKIRDWRFSNKAFFNAIKTEKNVMFLILTLIILVAAFNIISSLIILVKNKQVDIAILRTMGASRKMISKIFFLNGAIIGFSGTLIGTIIGILFVSNINQIKEWLENFTNTELFSADIYFFSSLPSKIELTEVFYVILTSLTISFLASFYPAYKAAQSNPADLIRKE